MGLDQYVYGCRKVSDEFKDHYLKSAFIPYETHLDIDGIDGLAVISPEELEESSDLKSIATPAKIEFEYLNMEKIFNDSFPGKDFDKFELSGQMYGSTCQFSYLSLDGKEHLKTPEFTDEDLKPYLFRQVDDVYVLETHEVLYFRKAYYLQHWLRNYGWDYDGNCVYRKIPEDILKKLIEDLEALMPYLDKDVPEEMEQKFHLKEFTESRYQLEPEEVASDIETFNDLLETIQQDPETVYCYYEWY